MMRASAAPIRYMRLNVLNVGNDTGRDGTDCEIGGVRGKSSGTGRGAGRDGREDEDKTGAVLA